MHLPSIDQIMVQRKQFRTFICDTTWSGTGAGWWNRTNNFEGFVSKTMKFIQMFYLLPLALFFWSNFENCTAQCVCHDKNAQ